MRMLEIHLEVSNIEKSLELYKKLIPFKSISHWEDGSAVALVLVDGSAFGLWKENKLGIHNGRGAKHIHYAFEIKPEEYEVYKTKIIDAGLKPLEYTWDDGHKSVYFFDFDNHQGEFMTRSWIKK